MMLKRDSIAGIITDNEVKRVSNYLSKKFDMTFVIFNKNRGTPSSKRNKHKKNIYSCN